MRAFIGIALPDAVRESLRQLQEKLAPSRADVKWVEPDNLHLTLKFLDEITEAQRQQVEAMLGEVASHESAFTLQLEQCGAFPSMSAPLVIWVGVAQGKEALTRMGETIEQRVEFIFEVKELGVDNFPINFLNPRPGTPLEDVHDLSPYDCLRIIAAARLAMPAQNIFVLGGREVNLKAMQSSIFLAGANGTMVGNYLTTLGTAPNDTVQMIEAMGLEIDRSGVH